MSESPQPEREQLSLEIEQAIDGLSDEFETAWRSGQAPRIEDYLNRAPPFGRSRLLEELLVVEFDLRQHADETIDIEFYHRRFPDDRVSIDAALALHERRRRGDRPRVSCKPQVTATRDDGRPAPKQIGRFEIRRRLGRGGYGVVYLAHDPGLDRLVALKVPHTNLLETAKQRESFLQEARTAAKLKHPALVTVYDVQHEDDLIYIVQEYVEGHNLNRWTAIRPRSWEDITRRMIEIAGAIGYVHQQGFYHRDLKPGNILIDTEGHAHVADFGLAVHENALRMLKGKAPGTPPYMSPEQIRGETHWIDGRSDIWALGVIVYELLAGHRPFRATDALDMYEEIQERDPVSPRMKHPGIPKELERICFKCLAKRRTQRYATALDLSEDLEAFLATCSDPEASAFAASGQAATGEPGSDPVAVGSWTVGPGADRTPRQSTPTPDSGSQPPLRIVPKGLRSFDEKDEDFFLELLPGPRDRDGLPDTIQFWKTGIEQTDADLTFPVGVMYGPSGCGKSSFVKAGLLPLLRSNVLPVFIEATPNETELRLLKRLRHNIPELSNEMSLAETLAQLREGQVTDGRKILLVLDQFEQWLHSTTKLDSSQLARSLRQCDGANVQCLLLVRDDFWMSTTRFMQALEIPLVENQNSAAVDLFDTTHAWKVLRAFGFAYGRLPDHKLSADEQRFLDQAVQELSEEGKVICVQLSLFADMMKARSWTPRTLREVGGTSGVGVAFLDETFAAKTAPLTHRLHAKAAQAVLAALLPAVGTDIKGQMQPTERLLECSGYANRHDDFRDLLHILNAELRLITPTEPEKAHAVEREPKSATDDHQFYQLTHDYLVPSLRDWLTRKQKETRRGRSELRLAECAALWNAKPENRYLPTWWEYVHIAGLTSWKCWTDPQRKMMRKAGTMHAQRVIGIAAALLIFATLIALWTASRPTNLDIFADPQRKISDRRHAFGHLYDDDSTDFDNALSMLETNNSPKFVIDSLPLVEEQLQEGRDRPNRRENFQQLLCRLLKSESRQADVRLAAFRTLRSIEKPIEVVRAIKPLVTEEDMPDRIRSEIASYLALKAEAVVEFELPTPTSKSLSDALIGLAEEGTRQPSNPMRADLFRVIALLAPFEKVLEQIRNPLPLSESPEFTRQVTEFIREIDLTELREDDRSAALRCLIYLLRHGQKAELLAACAGQLDVHPPDTLYPWLFIAYKDYDHKLAASDSLGTYLRYTTTARANDIGAHVEEQMLSLLNVPPDHESPSSRELAYVIQAMGEVQRRSSRRWERATAELVMVLEQRERLQDLEILDIIIQTFVQLADEPSKTTALTSLREILTDNAAEVRGNRETGHQRLEVPIMARVAAADALGSLGDIDSIPVLLEVSKDDQHIHNVRVAAIKSLRNLGVQLRKSGKSTTDIEAILRLLIYPVAHDGLDIRREAIKTFAWIADPGEVDILFPWTLDQHLFATGIQATSTMLLRDPEQTGPLVQRFLEWCVSQQDSPVRATTPDNVVVGMPSHQLELLSPERKEEGIREVVSSLRQALDHPDQRVRELAQRLLGGLGEVPGASSRLSPSP